MEFVELTEEERGFSSVFAKRIAPEAEALETARNRAKESRKRRWMIGGVLSVAAGIGVGYAIGGEGSLMWPVLLVLLFGAAISTAWGARAGKSYSDIFRKRVLPVVAEWQGIEYHDVTGADARTLLTTMRELKLVDLYREAELADRLSGSHRDVAFDLVKAHLHGTGENGDRWSDLLLTLSIHAPPPCPIFIGGDFADFGPQRRDRREVEIDHPAFARRFKVWAQDPQAARAYLPAAFLDTLVDVAERFDPGEHRQIRAVFHDDRFLLKIKCDDADFLALPGLHEDPDLLDTRLRTLIRDIGLPRRLIDRLLDT
ncbi:MAG: DUF3137 domain-containing protein [Paracoccaceae bacterium]